MGCGVSRGATSPEKSPETPEAHQNKEPSLNENERLNENGENGSAQSEAQANGEDKASGAENGNGDANGNGTQIPNTDGHIEPNGGTENSESTLEPQKDKRRASNKSESPPMPSNQPATPNPISAFASMQVDKNAGGSNTRTGIFNIAAAAALSHRAPQESPFLKILEDHSRFLISFVTVLDQDAASLGLGDLGIADLGAKPKLEVRQFKSHTMDNVRVRKMCDELLHLEDTGHKMQEDKDKAGNRGWMRTLQVSVGNHVHSIKLANNPEIKIGGYFIISQMLSYIKGLISLDLSSNELTAAEARVLAIGLKLNVSLQELRMKENAIGSEGATSLADALKLNKTLLLVDLRMNSIRGPGICVLADSVSQNRTLTSLDLRWNYAGESADFVETALLDLKKFCFRNMKSKLTELRNASLEQRRSEQQNGNGAVNGVGAGEDEGPPSDPDSDSQASTNVSQDRANRKPKEMVEAIDKTAMEEAEEEEEEPEAIGTVEVTIIDAKNLPQVIWTTGKDGEFLGLPQAYCVCSLGQSEFGTKIKKKAWNPKWDYTCSMDVQTVWNVCTVRVMHSKSTTIKHRDDYTIGSVNLPIGSVINWRGVSKGLDGTWRAFHKPAGAGRGEPYKSCTGKDKQGNPVDSFETAEAAAVAYDEHARKEENERAAFNMAGEGDMVGYHVKEEPFKLAGEDGVDVIGIQAGVYSAIKLRIKYFARDTTYLEMFLERASSLPKIDAGLGTCDAYANVIIGDYSFRSKLVKNSLDPKFDQWFRLGLNELKDEMECRVQIWDWDRFGDDDYMGDAIVKMPKEKILEPGALDGSYEILGPNGVDNVRNGRGDKSCIHLKFVLHKASEPIC